MKRSKKKIFLAVYKFIKILNAKDGKWALLRNYILCQFFIQKSYYYKGTIRALVAWFAGLL